ncbi:MAG: response regulator [Magnetococcales bacterium]|nr:response regulator [Magnetococcales bacterium]
MIQHLTKKQRYVTSFFIFAGLAFTLLLVNTAWLYSIDQDRKVFIKESESIAQSLNSSLVTTVNNIQSLAMLFRASENVSADSFQIFSKSILLRNKFIKSAIYMPLLSPGEMEPFEDMMVDSGYLTYHEREIDSPFLSEHIQKDVHLPIQFIEPFTVKNSTLLGLDIISHHLVAKAIERSIIGGSPTVVSLPQEIEAFSGLVFMQAMYVGRYEPKTVKERKAYFRGAIAMLIDPQILLPENIAQELEVSLTMSPDKYILKGKEDSLPIIRKDDLTDKKGKLTFTTLSDTNIITITPELKFILTTNKKIHYEELSILLPLLGLIIGISLSILGVMLVRSIISRSNLLVQQNAAVELEVKQQTAMLKLVLDTIPVRVFWKDHDGRYLGCNRLFSEDAQASSTDEIIGKTDLEMPWQEQAQMYRADDRKVLTSGKPKLNYEESQTTSYGRKTWLKTSKIPLPGVDGKILGILGVYEDITEQVKAKQKNRELVSELNFQKLSLDEHAIVSAADVNGNITYVNDKFLSISGYRREELIGRNHRMVKSSEHSKEFYLDLWQTISKGRPWHGEVKNLTKNGDAYWVRATIVPFLDERGKPFKYFSIRTDVTSMKEMEKKLQLAKDDAEAAGRAKSDFLANMSHEIRTPMNAIIGLSHLCLQTDLTYRQKDYINKVHSAASSLLRIINDILDFSKIDAGRLDMESINFTLEEVLRNLSSIISLKSQEKNLEFLMETAVDIPKTLVGDPLRLGQILINLANNAIKFTNKGEIAVESKVLQKKEQFVRLQFVVRDSGIGMTDEQKAGLFQAFSQADASITRKYGGTGLGLAISKRLIEMMDGNITVESEVGVGSKFIFDVRLGVLDRRKDKHLILTADLRGKKVLAVDDNKNAIKVISSYITALDLKVAVANNGKEAINAVQEAEKAGDPYELIVMDYMMPEMDGITAAAKIRHELKLAKPPLVIIATAYCEDSIIKRAAKEADVSGFLVKPINKITLYDAVMEAFGKVDRNGIKDSIKNNDNKEEMQNLSGARVLVVEDNEINQQVATELLEQANVTVLIANNGQEGIDTIKKEQLDAVLMDVQMPIMDGLTATKIIRENSEYKELPILAMTANAMSGDRDLCLDAGMQDHISKPIDPFDLYSTLGRWVTVSNHTPLADRSDKQPDNTIKATEDIELAKITGIDTTLGLQRIGGNQKAYLQLLDKFVKDQGGVAKEINVMLAVKDINTATRLAHTLKSVSGSIAAKKLNEISAALEKALDKGGDQATIHKLNDEVAKELDFICSAITDFLSQNKKSSKPQHSIKDVEQSKDDRDRLLRELNQKLAIFDSGAMETLDELKKLSLDSNVEQNIDQLIEVIASYDFEKASTQLQELAREIAIEL